MTKNANNVLITKVHLTAHLLDFVCVEYFYVYDDAILYIFHRV